MENNNSPRRNQLLLVLRNCRHFGQAHGTPFTKLPLSQKIDWGANSITSDLILEGNYTDDDIDEFTRMVIEQSKALTALDSISGQITIY